MGGPRSVDRRRIRQCVGASGDRRGDGSTAVLIRPDGYVAWVGEPTLLGLTDALTTWFGPPTDA